mmetsp:Transcript_10658/g.31557  ORF Transcript_10658/g.31557 Transcript_10658/m.31557 type:complete len:306 (-) Transcript_10658:773-1690(-)
MHEFHIQVAVTMRRGSSRAPAVDTPLDIACMIRVQILWYMHAPTYHPADRLAQVLGGDLGIRPPAILIGEVPRKAVKSADLTLLHGERLSPAVEIQLDQAEISTLTGQPSQCLHPWPVQLFVPMALAPTHLCHGFIPRNDGPTIFVIDPDRLATRMQQLLCPCQVLRPNSLQKTPLRGDVGRPAQIHGVVEAKRQKQIQQSKISLPKDKPNSQGKRITCAIGSCKHVHVLHGWTGACLVNVILLLLLMAILLLKVRWVIVRWVIFECMNDRMVMLAVLNSPRAVDAYRPLALHCHLHGERNHLSA